MTYSLNDTSSYHKNNLETLGWELTICNSLEDEDSPCRGILKNNSTFGNLLFDHIKKLSSFKSALNVIEIGGGYGFLMRDFLSREPSMKATMLDISKVLLDKQIEIIDSTSAVFMESDFFKMDNKSFIQFDMAILNEIIGDFPTLCNLESNMLSLPVDKTETRLKMAKRIINTYSIPVSTNSKFNFNIGALEAVEKLCSAGIKSIYISEHSCEAQVPDNYRNLIKISSTGNPERIQLKGHNEYTIKFSFLEHVAKKLGYKTIRGQYKDFIEIEFDDRINFILTSNSTKDEHEIIRHFIEDLYKYEYLLLLK